MPRHIVFHDPRLASETGGGETLTLRTIDVLDPRQFHITIVTRSPVSSPLLCEFLTAHPHVHLEAIEAPYGQDSDHNLTQFVDSHGGRALWGQDALVDDGIRFNSVAKNFYQSSQQDLVSFTFLTDAFGLELHNKAAFHIYGCLPPDMADAEAPLLRQMSSISAVSGFIRDAFCSVMDGRIRSESITILSPGLPPAFTVSPKAARKRDIDLVYAGRLVPRKGVDLVLEALEGLRNTSGLRPSLTVAGDGPEMKNLAQWVRDHDMRDQVSFVGSLSQSQLIEVLDRAKWFVYPTRKPEAFGLAPLEAMARGVPAIVGDLGGMADYMRHGKNGHVLEQQNAHCLTRVLAEACVADERRSHLVDECLQTADRFSWAAFSENVNAFFSQACDSVP